MNPVSVLTIDFDCVIQSMRDLSRQTADYYLDKTSGRVVSLSRELLKAITQDRDEKKEDVPAWDAPMMPIAREIVLFGSANFIRIPEAFGYPEHRWMTSFSETIRSLKLKTKIDQALRGRGSCKRFKEILQAHPEDNKRWLQHRAQCWREKVGQWLDAYGIIAVDDNPARLKSAA